ncbi:MAG TPA: lysophospholipid acyltransferase family protein [Chloroflexota bacterium]|nr:lysophospholipid acyltransferase family protein [Chloroflexota bacterium]
MSRATGRGAAAGAASLRSAAKLWGMRLGAAVVPRLPERLAYAAADAVALAAYGLAAAARRGVADNLSAVVDRHDPDLVALRAREAFRTQARNYADLFRLPSWTLAELGRRVEVVGEEHLRAAHAKGKGIVLGALHLGNLDVVIQMAGQLGYRLVVPVEPLEPPALLDLVAGMRAAHGVRVVPIGKGVTAELLAALRDGALVPLAVDRDVPGSGVETPFLGRTARLSHAAVALALRSGAPLLPVRGERLGDGRFRVAVGAPIEPPAGRRGRAAADFTLARLLDALSEYVRETPGQWVMFQHLFMGERRSTG